jgi:MHS family metabolite:H+ symporter-like MFS transporter
MTHNLEAPPSGPVQRTTSDLTKAAVSGWLGTAMEFMDFQLYSLAAAIVFNKIFFPDVSPAIGLIAAMATYGVGYVARLAGAIVFGRMGDRIGRKKVLFITIAMMGASTTLIGVLPTYAMIGILAPILLVVLRLIQGFGAGAEIAGATTMLAEYAPPKRRGLIAHWCASAPTPALWRLQRCGLCCLRCSVTSNCSAGAGAFRSCSASC